MTSDPMKHISQKNEGKWNPDRPKQDASHKTSKHTVTKDVNENFPARFRRNIQGTDGLAQNSFI